MKDRPAILFDSNCRNNAAMSLPAVVCLLVSLFLVWSCGPPVSRSEPEMTISGTQPLLVLPFVDLTEIYGATTMIKCPICSNYFAAGTVAEEADRVLTEQLVETLERKTQFRVQVQARPWSDFTRTGGERHWGGAEREMLVETGRSAGTQLVMTGYIYRFEQRVGSRYAVDSPASVALSVHIVSAGDGRTLWTGTIDETQSALSEDLFKLKTFLKRKGTWVTAEEMAASGLEMLVEELPLK
jgi:hypothetical protein